MSRFNLSRWAVQHPGLVGFMIALLFAAGGWQFLNLGRAEDPSFTIKNMVVSAQWAGASPAQMQSQVARPLEQSLRTAEGVEWLSTYCMESACVTQVVLLDDAPPERVPETWRQVRRKLTDLAPSMPEGVMLAANDDYADVYGYVFALTGAENASLVASAEAFRDRLLRVKGVGKIQISGELPRRIHVDIDPHELTARGLGFGDVARALSQTTAVSPSGSVDLASSIPVRVAGEPDGVDAVANTRLTLGDAASLRLGDVAEVSRAYADPAPALVRYGGEPAVVISVSMAAGADGLALGDALRQATNEARVDLPAGMALALVEDQSEIIREAVNAFLVKFAVALVVVLIVAFVALGVRTGVVVALSVPLTLAIVALFMGAAGIGLERISLGALILSLGLLVDDAIISVEAMAVRLEKGDTRLEAASYAWTRTAFPMLTGTLLTVVSFLPVGLAHSTTSEYAGGIFWVTGAALIVSWIVAVLFVPYMGARLLPEKKASEPHGNPHAGPLYRRLRSLIDWTLAHGTLVAVGTAGMLALSVVGALFVREQFFPLSDRPELIVDVSMTPGAALATTSEAVARIEQALTDDPDALHVQSHIGDGAPRFYLPYAPATPSPSRATLLIVSSDLKGRERLFDKLADMNLPASAQVHVQRLSLGPSAGFPIQYRVMGPDAEQLRQISSKVEAILRETPGAMSVQTDWGVRSQTMTVQADQESLARHQTDRASLAEELQAMLGGQIAGEVLDGDKRIGVEVRADAASRHDPGRWADLPVTTPAGPVPVGRIGHVVLTSDYPILWQRNGDLTMTVQAGVATGLQPAEVTNKADEKIAVLRTELPTGYGIEVGGDAELSATANDAIFALLPITLGLMLLLLMLQLQSFARTLLVLATAPLGLIGAVAALLVTGAPFGFVALLGLIALAGMIMRNTIILVDEAERNHAEGMVMRLAIVEATVTRARPVILTALAAVLAFIPLCFNIFWGPMAIVMIGGLIGATVLTLLALPAFYALTFDRQPGPTDTNND